VGLHGGRDREIRQGEVAVKNNVPGLLHAGRVSQLQVNINVGPFSEENIVALGSPLHFRSLRTTHEEPHDQIQT
jgi:hypothetical protein